MVLLHIFTEALKAAALLFPAAPFLAGLILTTLLFMFGYFSTYFFSLFHSKLDSREPITPRALIPFGYLWPLVFSPERFLRRLLKQLPGSPAKISIPTKTFYLAAPGEQVEWFFRNSRQLVPTPSLLSAFHVLFGLGRRDFGVFEHDHITNFESHVGFSTNHPDSSRRIIEHQRKDFLVYLRGNNLRSILHRFLGNLTKQVLIEDVTSSEWIDIPDMYGFMISRLFRAEVKALYGEHIFTVCPTFGEDFWAFYEALPTIAKGLPRWLSPSSYQARQKMLDNFQKWRTSCRESCNLKNTDLSDAEYHPTWGTQYIRRMVERHEDLGFTDDGISTAMLGYFFATVANSIPAAVWMLLQILLDGDLTSRVKSELSTTLQCNLDEPDVTKLETCPLFNSTYRETLRLRVASAVGRTSPTEPIHAAGSWKFNAGVPIMFSSWLGGLKDSFWNTGYTLPGGSEEHPVDSFWAERFLEYPDDSMSGPTRKPDSLRQASDGATRPKSARDDRVARIVTSGLQGHWFPFGGGASRCPGEALARQTILSSVAFMLMDLDIQLINPSDAMETSSKHRTLPFGSHAFDRQVPIRVRSKRFA